MRSSDTSLARSPSSDDEWRQPLHESRRELSGFGRNEERDRVQRRIGAFDWKDSEVWRVLVARYGPKLNQYELISIAELIAEQTTLKLDRDARRRKTVLLKWFQENWGVIHAILPLIVLD